VLCLNAGWYTEAILFTLKFAQSFKDCYKYLLYSPFTIAYWWSATAKFIDGCDNSNDEDVTIVEYNPVESATNDYWVGDGGKDNDGCWPGNLLQTKPGTWITDLIDNIFNLVLEQTDPIDVYEY
jgi:hypothetical protein